MQALQFDKRVWLERTKRLFAGFAGFLQTDGYEGYAAIGG